MPFDFGPWVLSPIERIARPVAVGPRGTLLAIDKFRCDSGARSQSVRARVTLPQTGDSFVVTARMDLCDPAQDGPNDVGVAPIGAVGEQSWPIHPYAVHVGSTFEPAGHATWGRADMDGDGRRDLVIAHRDGTLEVRTAARILALKLPRDMTRRIQGFGDLNGDGHPEVLLASTALGAGRGYVLTDGVVQAVTLEQGRLRLIGGPRWMLRLGAGHGDYFAGFTCAHGTVTQAWLLLDAPYGTTHTFRVHRTIWQVSGTQVHRLRRRTTIEMGDPEQLTRTRCPRG